MMDYNLEQVEITTALVLAVQDLDITYLPPFNDLWIYGCLVQSIRHIVVVLVLIMAVNVGIQSINGKRHTFFHQILLVDTSRLARICSLLLTILMRF